MLRRSLWALGLPLLLLAQQGEVTHEYHHLAAQAQSCHKAPAASEPCAQCLAYAQIAALASFHIAPPSFLAGLADPISPLSPTGRDDLAGLPPRSRGPPLI